MLRGLGASIALILVLGCSSSGGGGAPLDGGADGGGSGGGNTGGAAGSNTGGAAGSGGNAGGSGGVAGASGSGGNAGSGGAAGGGGQAWFAGVNLAGAEFGEGTLPGSFGSTYTYPTPAELDYFVAKGLSIFRVPFRWERLQQQKGAALDTAELSRLDGVVDYATGKGTSVILDPHNYARYFGNVIGSGTTSNADFADFWNKLAAHYKTNPRVVFGLMNEPHDMPTEQWLAAANAAIGGIRNAGAMQLVLVPGNAWTGAHGWTQNWYGTPNSQVMSGVIDAQNNFAFELHQYLDADYSGTQATCQSTTIGSEKLADVTNWLKAQGARGFLGELAGGDNATCQAAIADMLGFMKQNQDVWIGFTWWAAGPWWGDYMFTLEPKNLSSSPVDAPQLAWLGPYL